jgi:transketolase
VRNTFISELCALAERDERIWLLCGDLGYSVLERFAERFPERYVNVGVAEQNMVGVAAGLALAGKTVFTYSIANFPVMRCLEQIRNDVCYHQLNVTTVAVGGGLAYGTHGYTHHGVEDLAVMRALPHMTVAAPGDPVETRLVARALAAHDGPAYLRLGKGGEPVVHEQPPELALGRSIPLCTGDDVTLIATGAILPEAVRATDLLAAAGIAAGVLSMPFIKPLDEAAVAEAARRCALIVTVEEHSVTGGLGSAVAEVLAGLPERRARLVRRGTTASPSLVGSAAYLRAANGLEAAQLVEAVTQALGVARATPPVR